MSWTKVNAHLIVDPFTASYAFLQINILHWHIVDSQRYLTRSLRIQESELFVFSFPLVLEEFPELAENGAYSSSKQYTTKDLDDIVAYANSVR